MTETQMFTVLLPVDQHEELRRISYETKRPMAELVREAVAEWLRKQSKR